MSGRRFPRRAPLASGRPAQTRRLSSSQSAAFVAPYPTCASTPWPSRRVRASWRRRRTRSANTFVAAADDMSMSSPSVPSARPALAAPGWRPGPSTTLSVSSATNHRLKRCAALGAPAQWGTSWGRCCHGCCHGSGPPPRPERRKPYVCRAFAMRRRGLEPPPGYPGPGPQPGDPSVLCVQIAPERPMRPAIWTHGTHWTEWMLSECCHGSRRDARDLATAAFCERHSTPSRRAVASPPKQARANGASRRPLLVRGERLTPELGNAR